MCLSQSNSSSHFSTSGKLPCTAGSYINTEGLNPPGTPYTQGRRWNSTASHPSEPRVEFRDFFSCWEYRGGRGSAPHERLRAARPGHSRGAAAGPWRVPKKGGTRETRSLRVPKKEGTRRTRSLRVPLPPIPLVPLSGLGSGTRRGHAGHRGGSERCRNPGTRSSAGMLRPRGGRVPGGLSRCPEGYPGVPEGKDMDYRPA